MFGLDVFTAGYDRARSRFIESPATPPGADLEQGRLNDVEFCWILVSGCLCLIGFFVGFLFLGRIAFQI